jgi:hypothetical protein
MIVKFLRPSTSFKGVGYSFAKMLLDKGEMMQVKNFDALHGLSNPRAEDYVNYLEAVTDQSKRIVYPQLHVTISTKGRDHSKHDLTDIAEKWLTGMSYGNQPYLVIFHKDTQNNHVHLVSTRIGRDGKKISDSYERVNGYKVLNAVIGLNEVQQVKKDISHALSYRFSTRAQFMMLLEAKGYTLSLKDRHYQIFKFGLKQDSFSVDEVDRRIGDYELNKKRLQQLRAIIDKYRPDYDPKVYSEKSKLPGGGVGKTTGNSELSVMLQRNFGLQIFFHAKDGKSPYGYTIIDHAQKAVYKGGDLMPLAEFITRAQSQVIPTPVPKPINETLFVEFEDFEPLQFQPMNRTGVCFLRMPEITAQNWPVTNLLGFMFHRYALTSRMILMTNRSMAATGAENEKHEPIPDN